MSLYIGNNEISSNDISGTGILKNFIELPTEGLLFNLCALNYTSGSTVWHDTRQNIAMNAQNGSMTKTTVGGVPCVEFDGSKYWESSAVDGNKVDMTGEFTLVFVFNAVPPPSRRTIFEKAPSVYSSYEQELACTWETGNDISFYTQYNSYDYASTGSSVANQWNIRAIKMRADRQEAYTWTSSTWTGNVLTNRSNTPVVRAGAIRVGSGYAGTVQSGHLFSTLVYGVALSNSQMSKVSNYYTSLFTTKYGATLYN